MLKTTAKDVETLTMCLCTDWGICDARYADLSRFENVDPATFATRILEAEGMETNPLISEWHNKIEARVAQHLAARQQEVS